MRDEYQSNHDGDPDKLPDMSSVEIPVGEIRVEMPSRQMQWEYATVDAGDATQKQLNWLGKRGWQLCMYNPVTHQMVFIREIIDDQEKA